MPQMWGTVAIPLPIQVLPHVRGTGRRARSEGLTVSQPTMQEHRRFVRLATSSIEVRYTVIGQEAGGALQEAKDISEGGIRFPVSEQIPKGARLDLELQLPGEPISIQAQAEVVWCARFQGNGLYEIGCRFIQIDPLDRGKVIRHIHEALKQRKAFT